MPELGCLDRKGSVPTTPGAAEPFASAPVCADTPVSSEPSFSQGQKRGPMSSSVHQAPWPPPTSLTDLRKTSRGHSLLLLIFVEKPLSKSFVTRF